MLGRNLANAKHELEQIRRLLLVSNRDRTFVTPYGFEDLLPQVEEVDHTYWRAFEHCATITRAYATFERFVISSVELWVEWCLAHNPSLILNNQSARDAYERGLAEIIRRKGEARFVDVDRGKLAVGLSLLYTGAMPDSYALPTEPFFATLPNMRLNTVIGLFESIGLTAFQNWVTSSKTLSEFCIDEGYRLEEEITQFVERRNEAAHGNGLPSEILGTNELVSRITLLSMLCESIFQFIVTAVCRAELGENFEKGVIGNVTRVWPKSRAFELTMISKVIYTSTKVLIIEEGMTASSVILSLQLEGDGGLGFDVEPGTALGVVMPTLPKEGMLMIGISSVRGIDNLISGGWPS